MRIIITGPKCSGKSTIGGRLAAELGVDFIETDGFLEDLYRRETGRARSCREICNEEGEPAFRERERRAIRELGARHWCVIATGGGSMMDASSRRALCEDSIVVLLKAPLDLLWKRMQGTGLPPFLEGDNGLQEFERRVDGLNKLMEPACDIVLNITTDNEGSAHIELREMLVEAMAARMHSPNTIGEVLRLTTFGESHGPAVGAVLDGLPPGIELSPDDIQRELDRRRPGQSTITTQRREADTVQLLSGIFEGKTTGAPVCMLIYNRDHDPSSYEALRDVFRPGHADFTFWKKFGSRDHRGGGRSSGRETAARVAAGAAAKKFLDAEGIRIIAYAEEIAGIKGSAEDFDFIDRNPVRAADPARAKEMEEAIIAARRERDSVGGIVRLVAKNVPAGLGDPVFFKLDARLGLALFSIGAVKGVEFGAGFGAARLRGSENNDPMRDSGFLTNNAGGILGGISTGADITARIAVKPTPSIARDQQTIDTRGAERTISIEGRHDPCIVPRIVPVVEAMASLVILDALFIQKRIRGS